MADFTITVKISHAKRLIELQLTLADTVAELKQRLEQETGVSVARQKLFLKGPIRDDSVTLADLALKPTSRFMLVGTTDSEVAQASREMPKFIEEDKVKPAEVENPEERKIIEKGLPPDAMPIVAGSQRISQPISGLLNNAGAKVRITLKFDLDEMWISSQARTQKVNFAQVANVTNRPIPQYPGYLLVYVHLGQVQVLKFYFFPSQYYSHFVEVVRGFFF